MQARGYSLVEIVVVIGIASILLAIGTLRFSDYARRFRTEAQTRMIYDELLQARANAVYQRRETRIKFYPQRFEVYSSDRDSADGVAPVSSQALQYPIKFNNGVNVDFDERGVARNLGAICIEDNTGAGAVDSVVIAQLRVSIGKKDQGDDCNTGNITVR